MGSRKQITVFKFILSNLLLSRKKAQGLGHFVTEQIFFNNKRKNF